MIFWKPDASSRPNTSSDTPSFRRCAAAVISPSYSAGKSFFTRASTSAYSESAISASMLAGVAAGGSEDGGGDSGGAAESAAGGADSDAPTVLAGTGARGGTKAAERPAVSGVEGGSQRD